MMKRDVNLHLARVWDVPSIERALICISSVHTKYKLSYPADMKNIPLITSTAALAWLLIKKKTCHRGVKNLHQTPVCVSVKCVA